MPEYRRAFAPGGTFFLTVVTFDRCPLFVSEESVARLRQALTDVRNDWPFEILAAVVLPDHCHFIWELPPGDTDFSKRMGRLKALFTKSHSRDAEKDGGRCPPYGAVGRYAPHEKSSSRMKHRESTVWQRRFWEHTIRDEQDLGRHMDYIHYNPVKHGHAKCPHFWPNSSFRQWVERGAYEVRWCCSCNARKYKPLTFDDIENAVGE